MTRTALCALALSLTVAMTQGCGPKLRADEDEPIICRDDGQTFDRNAGRCVDD